MFSLKAGQSPHSPFSCTYCQSWLSVVVDLNQRIKKWELISGQLVAVPCAVPAMVQGSYVSYEPCGKSHMGRQLLWSQFDIWVSLITPKEVFFNQVLLLPCLYKHFLDLLSAIWLTSIIWKCTLPFFYCGKINVIFETYSFIIIVYPFYFLFVFFFLWKQSQRNVSFA